MGTAEKAAPILSEPPLCRAGVCPAHMAPLDIAWNNQDTKPASRVVLVRQNNSGEKTRAGEKEKRGHVTERGRP